MILSEFLVKELPSNLTSCEYRQIEQGYLCGNPVVRIRKKNQEYILTYKSRIGVEQVDGVCACNEVEVPLTEESFLHLREKIDGILIEKTRYLIPYQEYMIELDVFHGCYEGLVIAEVEFPSIEDSNHFVKPEWFGENVSDDGRYSNRALSEKIIDFSK